MYGPSGERRLTELTLDWLPGYEQSRPVRIGNAAVNQRQLDVYGEVMDTLYVALRAGVEPDAQAWAIQRLLIEFLESAWKEPDEGIWEVRGPRRHFTHSKVMAWVAVDRAIKIATNYGFDGPVDRWKALRDEIHADVCLHGFNAERNAFTQYYGGTELDASLLMIPLVGFLPPERSARRRHDRGDRARADGRRLREALPERGGAAGRRAATRRRRVPAVHVLALRQLCDVRADGRGARALRAAACRCATMSACSPSSTDPAGKRLLGNFPQAFSHVSLVNTALNLTRDSRPGARSDVRTANREVRQVRRVRRCAITVRGSASSVRSSTGSKFDGSIGSTGPHRLRCRGCGTVADRRRPWKWPVPTWQSAALND